MASTPLYKSLKPNGTSFYAFPGASEDISAAYQNASYRMYFSKFVLLNIPKQVLTPGTQSNPVRFDFENSFVKSVNATPTVTFKDAVIESLRNYVANQETVIRETRLNNQQYYYDTNALQTPTEKIFWKWCRKLNIIDFDAAVPKDEYYETLDQFQPLSNDVTYLPEYLWKEREVINWDTVSFGVTNEIGTGMNGKLEIEFNGETNFRVGDTARIYNVTDNLIKQGTLAGVETQEGLQFEVLRILPSDAIMGQRVVFNVDVSGHLSTTKTNEPNGQAELVYNRLVQYVGEVTGVSNVQEANRNYTEVYAHIPDHVGQTPDVLFRTNYDENYKPNMTFPILNTQVQPEIMGAELFNSPIVSNPQSFPGSYFGQFDTLDYTYETSTGDALRRSGKYYGVTGDRNLVVTDVSGLDGLGIDFNTDHYVKMNLPGKTVTNFDQFNALMVDNLPPVDFEFNAILWYYTVEDNNAVSRTNLYGISFLENPDNNTNVGEEGLRFPSISKMVSTNFQDGTSYSFNLSLNFNIINENPQPAFNPQAINSIFSMDLFNNAMQRLSSLNDSFTNIIVEQQRVSNEVMDMKSLLYTQNDMATINAKMKNLEDLLKLYSKLQIISSDSITATTIAGNPPRLTLRTTDTAYNKIDELYTTDMYSAQGAIVGNVSVPDSKDWMINLINNDETPFLLPNKEKLTLVISGDLDYKQSVEILIRASEMATENKKLDIYLDRDTGVGTQILLVGNIDLPVLYNPETKSPNSSALWKDFAFGVDLNSDIVLRSGPRLDLKFATNPYLLSNSIKIGDVFALNNFFMGTASVYDFSGQYKVTAVGATSGMVTFDLSSNAAVVDYVSTNSTKMPMALHGASFSTLSNSPYFSLNKGKKITVTRTAFEGNEEQLFGEQIYRVQVEDL